MTRIAIVGGHGQISQLLICDLVAAGHQPVALIRKPEQSAELEAMGAETALLDIEADGGERFGELFAGADAVVFAAGGGGDGDIERKRTVDLGGSLKSIAGAGLAGVKRFVQISVIGADDDLPDDIDDTWKAYMEAKRDADAALRDSDLEWTIIRPGSLTDEPGTGQVELGPRVERGDVPRADVAAVLAAVLDDPRTIGQQWTVVGGDTAIADAISGLV